MYNKVFEFAKKTHDGQTDKSGEPYIGHLIAVSNGVDKPNEKIVALLHDILEDTATTAENLYSFGLEEEIVNAVIVITKTRGEDYQDYLYRVKQNPLARAVKISDLKHNMDLSRLKSPTSEDYTRLEKYKKALEYLNT